MNRRMLAVAVTAALITTLAAGSAWARNPHCAGGIQYLTQSNNDKQKGNLDDAKRELQKAVSQLEQCSAEDPADFEAIGYLGWAYGLSDSICKAGVAFQKSIDGLSTKGDKKKLEMMVNNRESFWATSFNSGIAKINDAQNAWNPYLNEPKDDAEKAQKAQAKTSYDAALVNLNNALCLKPSEPRTLRNLGAIHAFMGDYIQAEKYFNQGLEVAKGDTDLVAALKGAHAGRAAQLVAEKKYDEAITYYQSLLKTDAKNADLWAGLADASLEKAHGAEGDAKKAAYAQGGEAYAKAAALSSDAFELHYNGALCYQNAGNLPAAEEQWRAASKAKPEDRETLMNFSSTLSDEKKFDEAIAAAMKAVALDPKDKAGHRQLSAIYNKAQDTVHAKQSVFAYLALERGKPADAPSDASGADGNKLSAKMGKPEAIYLWDAEGQKYETWFYWSKGQAFHFGGGTQQEKTDWSAALAAK